ncbi:hypothetical protein GCM10010525_05190 [Glutamicibacter bergerei]|uniref:Uncharacterized protein n=1 Tax=Glutamicibacter ardleyensis TaxID=225894 RepID=A0ABQ2DJ78_9MICC|nr:hypothetical protein GCM10007173_18420 [Glutamicibacter ardleyensis]
MAQCFGVLIWLMTRWIFLDYVTSFLASKKMTNSSGRWQAGFRALGLPFYPAHTIGWENI